MSVLYWNYSPFPVTLDEILIKEISIEVEWAITTKFYEHPKKEAIGFSQETWRNNQQVKCWA